MHTDSSHSETRLHSDDDKAPSALGLEDQASRYYVIAFPG